MKLVKDKINKIKNKKNNRKSKGDLMEQKLFRLTCVIFVAILIFVGANAALNRKHTESDKTRYITLNQAEKGTKEVYGVTKDSSGNVADISKLVTISCYGDSYNNAPDDYTSSYPGVLSVFAQRVVYNVAVDNDSIFEMAARQGGMPAIVNPFIIPTTKESTEVLINNAEGKSLHFDFSKNGGLNPCKINGVEGLLSYIDNKYCFTRAESGEENLVLTPTQVETRAMALRKNDICVFFLGDDNIYKTSDEAVRVYKSMVEFLGDNQNYLIVGPVKGETAVLDSANKALAEAFGDKFFNLREYLLTEASVDIKIELSEDDKVLADNGIVPYVYFSTDSNYFSSEGADAAGYAIYNKLDSLGYFSDASAATEGNDKQ